MNVTPKSENVEADEQIVRPKSTHRKRRSAESKRDRLAPVQDRSRRRNEAILQAAAELLETVNLEDLSHSDIAERAHVSKAAVYYHFPTIATIQRELALRYDQQVSEVIKEQHAGNETVNWQDLVRAGALKARDWFNNHRPACETLLGPLLTRENQLTSIQINTTVGAVSLEALRNKFYLPERPDLEEIISYQGEIIDLFWSRSYLYRGFIDDHALEESLRASLGYLRNYIPEHLASRDQRQD